ncbi:uncharacterized protein LOC143803784 [Ranitomeya variabilis]|uniref:uncharacterized protein LOC143803784 n=1 Tax=Ranitomeya variabilis TaxID=490064 RepID=UPI0040565161
MKVTVCLNIEPRGKMKISSGLGFLLIIHQMFSRTAGLLVKQPENMTAEAGESVTITCSFKYVVNSFSVTWTVCNNTGNLKDNPCLQRRLNFSTQGNESQVTTYERKSMLTIVNLTENDSLKFCCHILTNTKSGTGAGTRLEITPRSFPTVCIHKVFLLVEILRIICLVILITFLGFAMKMSC